MESQPQNTELGRLKYLLWFIFSLSKAIQPFKLETDNNLYAYSKF